LSTTGAAATTGAAEAAINAYGHYHVQVEGVPVHFMRRPGVGPDPVPLICTHGWPWTFWHWSKVIDPLADPGAHGGDPAEAFEVIVPSLPGFGFSTPLPENPELLEGRRPLAHPHDRGPRRGTEIRRSVAI
jgi:pimeloyl-ACP methyl ester carboxylesterase